MIIFAVGATVASPDAITMIIIKTDEIDGKGKLMFNLVVVT